jgi:hypothetical protein
MRNITAFRISFLTLAAALAWTLPAHAADAIETHWSDVCQLATLGDHLILATVNGETVESKYCVRVNADEIAVTTSDNRTIRIARAALSSLRLSSAQGHQLKALGHDLHGGLRTELRWLLSPMAPLGLVSIPSTLAWGAAAAPFCVLGDLVHKARPDREVKVLADVAPPTPQQQFNKDGLRPLYGHNR